jgi:hypothetical protein
VIVGRVHSSQLNLMGKECEEVINRIIVMPIRQMKVHPYTLCMVTNGLSVIIIIKRIIYV